MDQPLSNSQAHPVAPHDWVSTKVHLYCRTGLTQHIAQGLATQAVTGRSGWCVPGGWYACSGMRACKHKHTILSCSLFDHDTRLCVMFYQVIPGPSYTKAGCLDQFEGKDSVG